MTASDLFLAAMLLASPVGTPEQQPPADRWPAIQAALHQAAIDMEILDTRETGYVLAKAEDFQADLDFLRKRRADLADAPKLIDAERLPDRHVISEYIRFNRAYRKNLDTRLLWEADRADVIGETMRETDRLYKTWDAARDARSDFQYVTVRRLALQTFRSHIGAEAFDTAQMPAYVPDWRFSK